MHTYIHTCIHAYVHTYIYMYIYISYTFLFYLQSKSLLLMSLALDLFQGTHDLGAKLQKKNKNLNGLGFNWFRGTT